MAGQRSAVESSDTVLKCVNLELAKELKQHLSETEAIRYSKHQQEVEEKG